MADSPANILDLIYKIWDSLSWRKVGPVCAIILVSGLAFALAFWGLSQFAQVFAANPTMLSAVGGAIAGTGTGALATYRGRRRRAGRGTDVELNQESRPP